MNRRTLTARLENKRASFRTMKNPKTSIKLTPARGPNTNRKHLMGLRMSPASHLKSLFSLISILLKMMLPKNSNKKNQKVFNLLQAPHLKSKSHIQRLLLTMKKTKAGKARTVLLPRIRQHKKLRLRKLKRRSLSKMPLLNP
jgi:hypothetical protein